MENLNTSDAARQEFQSVLKGKNFMTPDILGYYKIKYGSVELSTGKGFSGGTMYGVTVVKEGIHNHELSKCVHSKNEAIEYIKTLKK